MLDSNSGRSMISKIPDDPFAQDISGPAISPRPLSPGCFRRTFASGTLEEDVPAQDGDGVSPLKSSLKAVRFCANQTALVSGRLC